MTTITLDELKKQFYDDLVRTDIAGCDLLGESPPGYVVMHINNDKIFDQIIALIWENERVPKPAFKRLRQLGKSHGHDPRYKEATLEHLYLKYASKYQADFPDVFDVATIKIAQNALVW